jgi:Zn-dependent protease
MDYGVQFVGHLLVYLVVWLFAVSAHEAAHAWTSWKFGDDTALRLGRVTLNPIPHIDPIGTLLLPAIGFLFSYTGGAAGIPLIMWGKPTPINPLNWRKKNIANICVSGAGIAANLLIAILASLIIKLCVAYGVFTLNNIRGTVLEPLFLILISTVILNVGLAVFNLLPFPPLDGSKILQTFLPQSFEPYFEMLETYGFIILFILLQMGVISFLVAPLNNFILRLLF